MLRPEDCHKASSLQVLRFIGIAEFDGAYVPLGLAGGHLSGRRIGSRSEGETTER